MYNLVEQIQQNKNCNGGGLATNITGRYESNRHAIARIEKYTFGEVVKELAKKKNGGLKISASHLLEVYTILFGTPEWHHAGKLPKSYGGGMKKTYFLSEIPTAQQVQEWLQRYDEIKQEEKAEAELERQRRTQRGKFVQKYGSSFDRVTQVPKFSVITKTEMKGKYGWFEVQEYHSYNLTEYYSGITFKSEKTLQKFLAI
ncbi:hypothetical protein ACILDU_11280 [Capnocytophaga canimorsus]|uniref:hypothetical protein n=1 Tax=Capnocytophaga canimorsus TaxID=28188 RepID=UPI0037D1DB82